ncbi:metallophosphoesterase [Sphingomonas radiodurans]|uniref:metallophosphoesterase n=1 Tax=Sphingomonas radiodurans TaxID=2890321 RepID=UPI001E2EA4CA|nr:metallophosphoesterase [Sphingomonas radiodurans]WBH16494.1 metallophosphoesterase [Sphingomonas radiodurans]
MKSVFVHLSDIHFGQEKDGGTDAANLDAKARLIDDVRAQLAKLGCTANGVIVTGDIAYSGQAHQYVMAALWLADLTDAVGCDRTDVQLIPGNHDVDRAKIDNTMDSVLFSVREGGDSWLDRHLDNPDDCAALYGRFDAYRGFALDYRCELDLNGGVSKSATLELAPGRSIRFVRLNSALICSGHPEEGKLILGQRQRQIPIEEGVENVVLSHHPLNWFQDSKKAQGYLRGRARVFISGHEHFPNLDVEDVEDGCQLMMLAAGATAPDQIDEKFTYKYNILTFEWDEEQDALAVTIDPRTWNPDMARFERDEAFLNGRSERQVLASPNFRGTPIPADGTSDGQAVTELVEEPSQTVSRDLTAQVGPGETTATPLTDATDSPQTEVAPEPEPTQDVRDLQLRFFQTLSEGQRLGAFKTFGLVKHLSGSIDHAMERRLFRRAIRLGKVAEIEGMLGTSGKGNGTK